MGIERLRQILPSINELDISYNTRPEEFGGKEATVETPLSYFLPTNIDSQKQTLCDQYVWRQGAQDDHSWNMRQEQSSSEEIHC